MAKTAKSKSKSGGARLIESGRSPMLLGLTPEERGLVERAAEIEQMPMTQFMMRHGLTAARRILAKADKLP